MPKYTPESQFEQYVCDSFEAITEKLERCPVNEGRIEVVEDKVLVLEEDKKWYKKIFVFVWGAIGGGLLLFIKNLIKGN